MKSPPSPHFLCEGLDEVTGVVVLPAGIEVGSCKDQATLCFSPITGSGGCGVLLKVLFIGIDRIWDGKWSDPSWLSLG